MKDRFTLTDIARHLDVSRPTAYRVIAAPGFPVRGNDRRWSSLDVLAWLDDNSVPPDTEVVRGVMVRSSA